MEQDNIFNLPPRGEFIDKFPKDTRPIVGQAFTLALRQNTLATAEEVVRRVRTTCALKLSARPPDGYKYERLRQALDKYPEEAKTYAAYRIACEELPAGERQVLKAKKQEPYLQEWMQARPPSIKQVDLLHNLGYTETPTTMADASRLITELLAAQKGRAK